MLLILGLVCIVVAGYFYNSGDNNFVNVNLKPSDIDYQATNIKATQTDNTGNIHYQMTATSVTHYQNAQTALLENPNIILYQGEKQTELTAKKAVFDEKTQIVQLNESVKVVSKSPSNSPIDVKTEQLIGNLAEKTLISQDKIVVTQNGNRFNAGQMYADVAKGEYQFEQVAMTFLPNNH